MGREIKAKAFDEYRGVFVRAKLVENESSNWIDERGFPVVWFTGLLDKNGVEIWEGDIVRWECLGGKLKGAVKCDTYIFFVEGFYLSYQDNPEDAFSENAQLEVIGNIHQHSELLEGEG